MDKKYLQGYACLVDYEPTIIDELKERAKKDYLELIKDYSEIDKTIDDAYRIAHYNEVYHLIDDLDNDSDYFEENDINKMLKYEGNIIYRVWESWLDYSHPEYYNFFDYETLLDIIKYAFKGVV